MIHLRHPGSQVPNGNNHVVDLTNSCGLTASQQPQQAQGLHQVQQVAGNGLGIHHPSAMADEEERKIVAEFVHLLEKSKQLFNGLRDLPPYGHKQWQGYFGRTFDIYTKLWKFQQQHRTILDARYGLKRWQIGEIASKIGQLYYHY